MPKTKTRKSTPKPRDPTALLTRGAIAILVLVGLAIGLNFLQQALFPDQNATPTPSAVIGFPMLSAGVLQNTGIQADVQMQCKLPTYYDRIS